mgnify:CR=1 FL=1
MNIDSIIVKKNDSIGFCAIIALCQNPDSHSSALGGLRCLDVDFYTAIEDVQRLARSMHQKAQIHNIPHFGGKSFLLEPKAEHRDACLQQLAQCINELKGRYIVSWDSGITNHDLALIKQHSPYVANYDSSNKCGLATATTVFHAITAALASKNQNLLGAKIAIQGLGSVGGALAQLCLNAGALVFATEINPTVAKTWNNRVHLVSEASLFTMQADVFAPCALSNAITSDRIKDFNCSIICGGANNQLSSSSLARELHERDILYIPEILANIGGLWLQSHYYHKPFIHLNFDVFSSVRNTTHQLIEQAKIKSCPILELL